MSKVKSILKLRNKYLLAIDRADMDFSSRKRDSVLIRNAFACACRGKYTCSTIGGAIHKDHTTVIAASKNHEMNCKYFSDYQYYYDTAKRILAKAENKNTDADLRSIYELQLDNYRLKKKIVSLRRTIDYLSETVRLYELKEKEQLIEVKG